MIALRHDPASSAGFPETGDPRGGPLATTPRAVAVRAAWVCLLATSLEVAIRSVGPVPFAPRWSDAGVRLLLCGLAASPALVLARTRLASLSVLFLAAPFALLLSNLGFTFGVTATASRIVLAFGGLLLGSIVTHVGSGRSLATAAVLPLLVAGVIRWRSVPVAPGASEPSVLVVVFDTTAVSHLSAYGYQRPTTPNLAAQAHRSLVYRRAVAAAPWTVPSHGAMFFGRYPSELGFHEYDFEGSRMAGTLADDLAATGRAARAISANPWVPQTDALRAGFGAMWDVTHLIDPFALRIINKLRHHWGYKGSGKRVTDLALDWIDRLSPRAQPWFLFLNFMDPHAPYAPPPSKERAFAPGIDPARVAEARMYNSGRVTLTSEDRTAVQNLYDGEIAEMDEAFGQLLRGLEKRGYDSKNLLLIVTADHGENLGEHGLIGHLLGMSDALLHVPLLISGPGVPSGEVVSPVQTVQLRATVRVLLGLEALPDIAPPLPPWGPPPSLLISERSQMQWYFDWFRDVKDDVDVDPWSGDWVAVERDGLKVVFDDRGRGATYDLRTDPGEDDPHPLSEGAALVQAYREWQQASAGLQPAHLQITAPPPLRALGYIQ